MDRTHWLSSIMAANRLNHITALKSLFVVPDLSTMVAFTRRLGAPWHAMHGHDRALAMEARCTAWTTRGFRSRSRQGRSR
jgi:hypothetical protein